MISTKDIPEKSGFYWLYCTDCEPTVIHFVSMNASLTYTGSYEEEYLEDVVDFIKLVGPIQHTQKSENENLKNQIKDAQETTDKLGIIGMVGSIAWKAQILKYKELTTGWENYAWKNGKYIDDIQEYLDEQLGRPDE